MVCRLYRVSPLALFRRKRVPKTTMSSGRTPSIIDIASPALFPVRNTSQNMATVSNTVVGSQVVSVQVGGIDDGTRLTKPVTFLLRLTNTPSTGMNEFIARGRGWNQVMNDEYLASLLQW